MREKPGRRESGGFTLMEVVVSLAVIAVAATIGISLFADSYAVGNDVRDRRAAQRLAEEILSDMRRDPASFVWPAATDQLQPVTRKDDSAQSMAPSVGATYEAANRRVESQYNKFRWHAYVKAAPGSKTAELTVVVSWIRGGRTRGFTLTSLAPLDMVRPAA